ncbi:MAG: UTP--glucose-1-phosphate uridylyltransferase [Verrucomicrobia bacterium]|nr:UTP--glucose-1-phosphate uridylyltransferase [Verrucomicrobiota bacterium]
MSLLVDLITSAHPATRNRSLDSACASWDLPTLLAETCALDAFRRNAENLYERVRSQMFLYAIHRFHLPPRLSGARADRSGGPALIPFRGYEQLLQRRFEEAIDTFLAIQNREGPSDTISSALAAAYHRLAFQTLADQVRRSVRGVRGNQWMFRMGHPADQPLRLRSELLTRDAEGSFPILREQTPVRMDLSHSAWSDIFFLGMDFPEGARVLNVSIDLGVHGRDAAPRPPVSAWLRVIEEPVLRLTSVDLGCTADVVSLADVFNFAQDHLGLLKAAVIASGIVPPGVEGSGRRLSDLLARMAGPGLGLELVSHVNGIPKGSRLAVSTNLLGCLIAVCMRATSQAAALTGDLDEAERRLVLARALLGEWLGGSGGGWQDSGGIWPGMKLITGVEAQPGDAEFGVSRGRLLPHHVLLTTEDCSEDTRRKLEESLVLVHGGMAQNVGTILEMVTEKYLLRSESEWQARARALEVLGRVLGALREGDVPALGRATSENFAGPIQAIIPWATNAYTESLIASAREAFGKDFWGFWMLGGMSGGGMGFMFAPHRKQEAQTKLLSIMTETKRRLQRALPFAMDPVVYDFAVNQRGTQADLLEGVEALMPAHYYSLIAPTLIRQERHRLPRSRRVDLDRFGAAARSRPELRGMVQSLFDALLPRSATDQDRSQSLARLLEANGFDRAQHDQIASDLKEGRIGLAQNRLRADTVIEDARAEDLVDARAWDGRETESAPDAKRFHELGVRSLLRGEVAVVTLAAGAGSRWTQGAGVCKALHPFSKWEARHRTFIEAHLAKSRKTSRAFGAAVPHIFTTSYLTHEPIQEFLEDVDHYKYEGPLSLSPGQSVGLRMIPTERDLRFAWEEMPQQRLDEQQQKMGESLRNALIQWARSSGEAADYTDNLPLQCLHPVGHWYEVPNLFRNGVLLRILQERPELQYLLLHNVDTLGANLDPTLLGHHIESGRMLTFEVIRRRMEDRGGGLARINGRARLIEGLALPREEDEFQLSCYNTMTTWIHLDSLLRLFGLQREDLANTDHVIAAIRAVAARLPTYITLKDVKKRWGHGQEDVFPVTQFEKLWSDLTALPEAACGYALVSRERGQQLKDIAQLDGWRRDGSADYVGGLCDWSD